WLPWAQLAEVGGTPLLDLMTVGVGAAAWHALHHRSRPAGVLAALLVALPLLYGTVRIAQVDETRESAPILRVGVIQPNVGIYDKHDARLHHGHLVLLQRMTQTLERLGADVVIWPESAYPFPFPRGVARDVGGRYAIRQRGVRGPLLVGAVTRASRCDRWNSALAIDDQGFVRGVADKVELLAFGETVPLWHWLPPLQSMFPCPGLRSAAAPKVLTLHEVRYGVLNCYEDVLGRHARTVAGLDPELLVNITNDAWFGDTLEPHLHQLVARVRSIETRRDLVRAVNTGVSAHIDATGRTRLETETFTQDSFIATARRLEGTTVWVTIGDVVTPIAYAYLLAWGFRRRRA
ncbi:MAG: apolipoprotein N-acyltransferase, partial [Myxococcota bacterium]